MINARFLRNCIIAGIILYLFAWGNKLTAQTPDFVPTFVHGTLTPDVATVEGTFVEGQTYRIHIETFAGDLQFMPIVGTGKREKHHIQNACDSDFLQVFVIAENGEIVWWTRLRQKEDVDIDCDNTK